MYLLIDFCSECRYTYGQPVKGKVFVSFAVKLSRWARESQTTVVDEVILRHGERQNEF